MTKMTFEAMTKMTFEAMPIGTRFTGSGPDVWEKVSNTDARCIDNKGTWCVIGAQGPFTLELEWDIEP